MDATRNRRTRDAMRLRWYSYWRCRRFARFLNFTPAHDAFQTFKTIVKPTNTLPH